MSEQKHTAAPWRLEGSVIRGGSDALNIFHVPVGIVNDVAVSGCPSRKEAKANAHLIAAAPDLLEALKGMHEAVGAIPADSITLKKYPALMDAMFKADDALIKATGEQQ